VGTHSELLRDSPHYRHVISSLEDALRQARQPAGLRAPQGTEVNL
jgi:hypothetical protein